MLPAADHTRIHTKESAVKYEGTWHITEMESRNKLEGKIKIHHGDSSTLSAERAPKSKSRK